MDSKIVGTYRIKNEERWIAKSLESILDICSEIIILDDGSTDDTVQICEKCPEVVKILHQEDIPFDETRDKNALYEEAKKRNPDFILTMDGDEIFPPNIQHILLDEIKNNPQVNVFEFQTLFIWNKPNQYRSDGIYQNTWQKRLLRMKPQPADLHFDTMPYPGNMHCPQIPQKSIGFDTPFQSKVIFLHYGYYDENLRQTKFNLYRKMDPNNISFDGYKHIISDDSVLAGPHGMEFNILPEGMYIQNIDNSSDFSETNIQNDYSQDVDALHISGLKSHIQEIFKDKKRIIKEKDNHLEQVIKDKDDYLEQVIKDKDNGILGLQNSLDESSAYIKKMEQVIKDKDDYLEQVIKDKDNVMLGLQNSLDESSAYIKKMEQAIKDKDDYLEQVIKDKDNVMLGLQNSLEESSVYIKKMEQAIKDKDNVILGLQNSLEESSVYIKKMEQAIKDKDDYLEQVIKDKDNVILGLQNSLEESSVYIKKMEQAIKDKDDYLEQVIKDKDNVMLGLQNSLDESSAYIKKMEQVIKDKDD